MDIPEKKQRVLQAAIEVFSEQGFHQATIDHIAERAGVGKGTVYLYFESKQNLFFAIIQEGLALVVRGAAVLIRSEPNPLKRIELLIGCHLEIMQTHVRRMRMIMQQGVPQQMHDMLPEIQQRLKEYKALYVAALEEGISQGRFRPHDTNIATVALIGALNQVGMQLAERAITASVKDCQQQLLQFVLSGIEKVGD